MDLSALRREYVGDALHRADLAADPEEQFRLWFDQAEAAGNPMANAMTLATLSADGTPSVRVVLLKGIEEGALVFYTDYTSRKSLEIGHEGRVALNFFWGELERQVSLTGTAVRHTREAAETYFRTRPRDSQVSAMASEQGAVIADRAVLEGRWREVEAEYAGREIPCKESWGGFRVVPDEWVFWQGRESRLHDRFRYTQAGAGWVLERLSP